jgi:DNA-binding transcriptional LysR family regulator
MELGELKVFLTVATERSFSRAAAKLYRTQPAVSQAVRRLEDQLGERLFDRTSKHATLTDAGVVLFREGTRLVRLADETTAAVRRQSERGRVTLRIGGSELAAHVVLPSIAAFLAQHQDMSVEFCRASEADAVAGVAAEAFDIGIVINERIPAQFQQLRVPIPAAGFSVILPRTHRLAALHDVPLSMIKGERLILLTDPDLSEGLTTIFAESNGAPALVIGMPGVDSLRSAVEMGLGIGIVPGTVSSACGTQRGLAARPLISQTSSRSLTLIYTQSSLKHTLLFIEIMRNATQAQISDGETPNVRRTTARI